MTCMNQSDFKIDLECSQSLQSPTFCRSHHFRSKCLPGMVCLISEIPGDHSLRGDDIGTRRKMGRAKERQRKSMKRLQLQWIQYGKDGDGGGDSFCIFREVSLWERHRWERRTGGREAWSLEGDTALWQWDKLPPFHFGLLFWEVVKAYACLSVFPLGLSSRCSSLEGLYNGTNIYKI